MLTGLGLAPEGLDIQPFPFLVPCGGVSMSFRADLCQMPREAVVTRSPALREALQLEQEKLL